MTHRQTLIIELQALSLLMSSGSFSSHRGAQILARIDEILGDLYGAVEAPRMIR